MFRISQYLREVADPTPIGPARQPPGPVVIWNLIRRCNLACKHCYSISADHNFPGELETGEIFRVMDELKQFSVPVLILSGGEPLLHPDIYEISRRAKSMGFYVGLSTNGTLINETNIDEIAAINYNYIGISIDGLRDTHDRFRRREGAFDDSLNAIRLCRENDLNIGMRFTITKDNATELPDLLDLMDAENVHKFYLSHLNYSGRGNRNRKDDATYAMSRQAVQTLIERCWSDICQGKPREYVTGNNDADAVFLLHWIRQHYPERYEHILARLRQWGGNSSGVNIANIDNLGNVHPDTFWWHYSLGNVKERRFSEIWSDTRDPIMAGLKQHPRKISGRCASCHFFDVCGGNTRIRAWQLNGDPWSEDPGCYLYDHEIHPEASNHTGQRQDVEMA